MSATSHYSMMLVIDASIAVWAALPLLQAKDMDASGRLVLWRQQGRRFVAPSWWPAECTSAIRMALYHEIVTVAEANHAIDDIFALEVELLPLDISLCKQALEWAARLKQVRAYDSFYLALAERSTNRDLDGR